MPKKKKEAVYTLGESLNMLNRLQIMAIDEGNINLALKAEELKCKIITMQAGNNELNEEENLTKILVDFINGKQNSPNTGDIRPVADDQETL